MYGIISNSHVLFLLGAPADEFRDKTMELNEQQYPSSVASVTNKGAILSRYFPLFSVAMVSVLYLSGTLFYNLLLYLPRNNK